MKKALTFFTIGLAFASCSNELVTDEPQAGVLKPMTFRAQNTDTGDTKTSLQPNNEVYWSKGDSISLFAQGTNYCFRTQDTGPVATFHGQAVESDLYYALYPYDAKASGGEVIETRLPEVQFARENSFDEQLNISVAKSDRSNVFYFSNICSLIKFKLDEDVKSVTFYANGAGYYSPVYIAGDMQIKVSDLSSEIMSSYSDRYDPETGEYVPVSCSSSIKLLPPRGESFLKKDVYYYLVVKSGITLTNGFRMMIQKDDFGSGVPSQYMVSTDKKLDLKRGGIVNLGTISCAGMSSDPYYITNKPFIDWIEKEYGVWFEKYEDGLVPMTDQNREILSRIDSLKLSDCRLQSLSGIEFCTNLKYLDCSKNNLADLDLSYNTQLKYLDCSQNRLSRILYSQLPGNLEYLDCSQNQLSVLDLTSIDVSYLDCSHNQLKELNLYGGHNGLEHLDVSFNQLKEIPAVIPFRLTWVNCSHNQLEKLSEVTMQYATFIDCSYNKLKELKGLRQVDSLEAAYNPLVGIVKLPKNVRWCVMAHSSELTGIDCSSSLRLEVLGVSSFDNLKSLDVSMLPDLKRLEIQRCGISELMIGYKKQMSSLRIQSNLIKKIDLTECHYNDDPTIHLYGKDSDLIEVTVKQEDEEFYKSLPFYGSGFTLNVVP